MKFLFFVFFIFMVINFFFVAEAGKAAPRVTDCADPNEVYLYCGSACPARCGDRVGDRTCSLNCVEGCFCKKGFILNSKNKCVAPAKC